MFRFGSGKISNEAISPASVADDARCSKSSHHTSDSGNNDNDDNNNDNDDNNDDDDNDDVDSLHRPAVSLAKTTE